MLLSRKKMPQQTHGALLHSSRSKAGPWLSFSICATSFAFRSGPTRMDSLAFVKSTSCGCVARGAPLVCYGKP